MYWLSALAKEMKQTQAAVVGGANVPPSAESVFCDALGVMLNTWLGSRGSTQGMVYAEPCRMKHIPGLNVLFRKDALDAVGGYDERFRLVGEDEDLSHRLRYEGSSNIMCPALRSFTDSEPTSDGGCVTCSPMAKGERC